MGGLFFSACVECGDANIHRTAACTGLRLLYRLPRVWCAANPPPPSPSLLHPSGKTFVNSPLPPDFFSFLFSFSFSFLLLLLLFFLFFLARRHGSINPTPFLPVVLFLFPNAKPARPPARPLAHPQSGVT